MSVYCVYGCLHLSATRAEADFHLEPTAHAQRFFNMLNFCVKPLTSYCGLARNRKRTNLPTFRETFLIFNSVLCITVCQSNVDRSAAGKMSFDAFR